MTALAIIDVLVVGCHCDPIRCWPRPAPAKLYAATTEDVPKNAVDLVAGACRSDIIDILIRVAESSWRPESSRKFPASTRLRDPFGKNVRFGHFSGSATPTPSGARRRAPQTAWFPRCLRVSAPGPARGWRGGARKVSETDIFAKGIPMARGGRKFP